jgi:hypothetical protein
MNKLQIRSILIVMVSLTFVFIGIIFFTKENIFGATTAFLVAMILSIVGILKYREFLAIKAAGEPNEDERSKKVQTQAGYSAYFISNIIWIGLYFFAESLMKIEILSAPRDLIGLGILLSALSFSLTIFIINRKSIL